MEVSKIFSDQSIDQLIADPDFSRFIKIFGLPYSAADLDLAVQNLLDACQLVSEEFRTLPKLDEAICVLTRNKLRLESLASKAAATKLIPKDGEFSCLLAYSRLTDAEKPGLALVLVTMYIGDYHPKTLVNLLAKHISRDPLPELSFHRNFRISKALEKAKLQSRTALERLVVGVVRSPFDQLQAHYGRREDIHDLQRKRLLFTHSRFSKEHLIEACAQIQKRVEQGDSAAICELLSLHANCPPSLLLALPCWPQPGAFHWLSIESSIIYTSRSLFLPNGRVLADPVGSAIEWYLAKPIARVLCAPLKRALANNPEAKTLGDLLGIPESTISREFPELTDIRNRLGIEGSWQGRDDVLAAFAFSDPRLLSRGPAYYQKIKQREAVQLFCSVFESFGISMGTQPADSTLTFGSMVQDAEVAHVWSEIVAKVQKLRPARTHGWTELVEYHNAYVILVAFICSIALAFRSAKVYPLMRCSLGTDYLVFNDKKSHDVIEFSEVPFGETLKTQLDFYLKHLVQLHDKARNLGCSDEIVKSLSRALKQDSSEPLIFRISSEGSVPLGSADVTNAVRKCGFNFPPNFGRHLIQSNFTGLSRVQKNKVSRHGSLYLSSNNIGVDLSPNQAALQVVQRSEDLFKRLAISPVAGL